jgi:hypothetical protein
VEEVVLTMVQVEVVQVVIELHFLAEQKFL